nr:lantibiotic protection ABC transporter ATP-binding protein [uncultured Acetobacterium sp.]
MERTLSKPECKMEDVMTCEYIIKTNHVSKKFKKAYAIKDLSMSVRKNSVYGLLGPNGAGKSTLLKMITGIIRPTSGEIFFNNHPWTRKDLLTIGSLIESPPLYENLTAFENLNVRATLMGISTKRCHDVLRQMDLMDTKNKKTADFSLGMKQRLGIALALLNNPRLLVLDEPTNGLDPFGIEELRRMLKTFAESGISVVISSHILSEVQQVADDIGILSNGSLLYQDKIDATENLEQLFMDIIKKERAS